MKVNGHKLQQKIRELQHRKEVAFGRFREDLWAFPGETKHPADMMKAFTDIEEMIARFQVAQQRYNLMVEVEVLNEVMPLATAIKMVGGVGRAEKAWRTAAKDTGRDRYSYREMSRKKDEDHAQRVLSLSVCMEKVQETARKASALREAIAKGNITEIDIRELILAPDHFQF